MTKRHQNIYRALIMVLMLGMAFLFYRARALAESRRDINHTIGNSIHTHWQMTHIHLNNALERLEHPDRGSVASDLELAEQELRVAAAGGRIYSTALNYGLTNRHVSFEFATLMMMYAQEIGGIRRQVQSDGTLSPELVQSLTLLRDDLDLLIVHLPAAVLAEADLDTVGQAVGAIKPKLQHPIGRFMYAPGK